MAAIDTCSVMNAALSEALQTMAFLMVMPAQEQLETPESIITAEIEFTGPVSGKITAAAGLDFARVLADNVSGLNDVPEEVCIDAMKELVNVTCGLVLPMVAASPADVFDLTVPHLAQSEDRLTWEEFVAKEDVTVMDVEGWPLAVHLQMHA